MGDECGILKQPSYPVIDKEYVKEYLANQTHYGDPASGCMSDEQAVKVQGLTGDFCAPDCKSAACPTDVPAGVTAKPQCALSSPTGDKKCALICSPSTDEASLRAGDAQCGAATCSPIQSVGICTYGGSGPSPPGPPPPRECDIPTGLKCAESVEPCIAQCKQGVADCIKCLGPNYGTCCPCLKKVIKALPCPSMDVPEFMFVDVTVTPPSPEEGEFASLWSTFKSDYSKVYASVEEELQRFAVFKANVDFIMAHNKEADVHGYTTGINQFADMSRAEFKATMLTYQAHRKQPNPVVTFDTSSNPSSVDWTTQGAVTPVKNQGQCGSCWAFSTTGSTEGAYQIATGKLVSFSEQELVDCAGSYGNQGCNGGLMDDGFKYLGAKGDSTESSYAYTGKTGTCSTSKQSDTAIAAGKVTSFSDVTTDSETQMLAAVTAGPVSVAIEADQSGFQFYKSGVFSGTCGTNLDHGVLVVGYGTDSGKDYWKVKNSWGTTWGDAGYIRLVRSSKTETGRKLLGGGGGGGSSGECGLLKQPSYPVISKSIALGLKEKGTDHKEWTVFKTEFKKIYESVEEHNARFETFLENLAFIKAHNAKSEEHGYTVGMNQFGDMSSKEFKKVMLTYRADLKKANPAPILDESNLADSVDWVAKGAVTPVKNQGQCCSCWAFSTTGSTEGAYQIATGKLLSFSEQELVDCAGSYGNQGCNGGLMDNGFKYLEAKGDALESKYSYTGKTGTCSASKSANPALKVGAVTSFNDVTSDSASQLMAAVNKGPVSVAIEA